MDKDKLKQQPGPQQGNIHQDANEGTNTDGHRGSTLEKMPGKEKVKDATNNDENGGKAGKAMDSEQDTIGNP